MRRWTIALSVLLGIIVVVLIFMLTRNDGGDTTTTALGATTTSTFPGSTSTVSDGTTTRNDEPTTTTQESTTTSVAGGLEGNWAAEPLVAAGFGGLGWWDGGNWVQVDEGTTLPVSGGEDYQIALLGVHARTTGSGEELLCEPLDNPGVVLADEDLLGTWPGPFGVAISADWDLVPNLVEETVDDGTYASIASQLLADQGLTVTDPLIKQVIRVDLEGEV